MKVMVIIGSVREGRKAEAVANWAVERLRQDSDIEVDVADLKEVDLPFFNEATIPSGAHGQFQNPKANAWVQRVAAADAFIMTVAEYNHGPTPVLKNAIDWVYEGWQNKPVGFISYGGIAAGTRAAQQLKQNVLNVQLYPTLANVHIPFISQAFDENGQPKDPEHLNESFDKMLADLKQLQGRLAS
jgi:NAD(P)H-dependent FMN reductase